MAELLFEIFCEEIPARMQVKAGKDLEKALTGGLKGAGLEVKDVRVLTGPRRLIYAADVPLRSPDISEERKGPKVGSAERALEGFMRAAGLTDISQAQIKTDPKKGEFYVAIIEKAGADTADILGELIPNIMNSFPWPKSMKSGGNSFRWVRPLQSMICLLDGKVVPVSAGGATASNMTEGHRRHGKGPFTVKDFADYQTQLEGKGHVILDPEARKALILKDARAACAAKGVELVEDIGLLNEVAGLAEWPVVILGDMDPSFLELPAEVIRLSMRTHQKYFAVKEKGSDKLAPHFIVVANQAAPDGGTAIAKGNSKVLSARLADAQFFQSEDAKKKLIDYYDKLGTVVFHKKLGSIRDKAERVAALAKVLAPKVGADPKKAEQAAKLAKCDLVTNMVIEFTSLQGQIGADMYRAEGGDAAISTAIEQHYKPQGPSDSVSSEPTAIAVALADKLDTLVGFWAIDEKPTGSKDPYALRRAALGVVRIILENGVRLNLKDSVFQSSVPFDHIKELKFDGSDLFDSLLSFILDRLKGDLRDKGMRHDIIDAVFAPNNTGMRGDDLVDIVNRTKALQSFIDTEAGENLLAGYKRAANILKAEAKKGELPEGSIDTLSQPEAVALQTGLTNASAEIEAALASEAYPKAMTALSKLHRPIDDFFDNVMVVDEDADIRRNNLLLLKRIRDTASQIADFEKISG